jgi:hypothetical protein
LPGLLGAALRAAPAEMDPVVAPPLRGGGA